MVIRIHFTVGRLSKVINTIDNKSESIQWIRIKKYFYVYMDNKTTLNVLDLYVIICLYCKMSVQIL